MQRLVISDIPAVVNMNIIVFGNIQPCSLVDMHVSEALFNPNVDSIESLAVKYRTTQRHAPEHGQNTIFFSNYDIE
jgi:hypothetical protein